MADAIRLLSSSSSLIDSLRLSSPSLLSSFHFASYFPQSSLGVGPANQNLDKNILARLAFTPRKLSLSFKAHATFEETEPPKWWERNAGPNMIDIHSTQEFLSALSRAGERLVIVEFYGTWCASCRALFPKLCKTAQEHPEIIFLKVNFDENKPMCKSLNVRVLPYLHFYRGADGQLESFSCSLAKFQKIKDAIETHNTDRCSIGPPKGVGDLLNVETVCVPKTEQPTGSS